MQNSFAPWQVAELQRLSDYDPAFVEECFNTLWEARPDLLDQLTDAAIQSGLVDPAEAGDYPERASSNPLAETCIVVCDGHMARLAESGIPIWEIVRVHRTVGSMSKLLRTFRDLSLDTIESALSYAEENPEEIDSLLREHEAVVESMLQV